MKIIQGFPPNIKEIESKFSSLPLTVVFTYGDTLYVPSGRQPDAYLLTHEETHQKQQGDDVEGWWKKYLSDDKFRLDQEVEAYRNQYQHFCRNQKNYDKHSPFLDFIATALSGPMYGNILSKEEAKELIK